MKGDRYGPLPKRIMVFLVEGLRNAGLRQGWVVDGVRTVVFAFGVVEAHL
jgi:hypothetical protein